MTKGIIVLDIPETCSLCPLEREGAYCIHVDADTMDFRYKGKHVDCPIKPLPEKMDCQSHHGLLQEQIMVGWNMCIDEILGEDNDE